MQGFIFSQPDCTSVWEGYARPTERLDSVNETVLSLYLHCTTAPTWCHYKQLFGWDPPTELAITSQQLQPLFLYLVDKMIRLLLYIFKGSCLNWSKAEGGKKSEQSSHLSQFISVWKLMYEVWERFLKCMSNTQTCNYSNSDMVSLLGGWQLRRPILKDMLHKFPISAAVTLESLLPCSSLDLLTNQTGKTKERTLLI